LILSPAVQRYSTVRIPPKTWQTPAYPNSLGPRWPHLALFEQVKSARFPKTIGDNVPEVAA
jgi:hypothetical protein